MGQMQLFETDDLEVGARLLDAVVVFLQRFVRFTNRHQVNLVALWVAHTHLMDAAQCTPRLAVISPEKRAAKSRLLELLSLLVKDPLYAISCTGPALFHAIDERSPTVLIDEVDTTFSRKGGVHEDLRAVINAGHRRGATVPRVGRGAIREFQVFAPVALAGIGDPPDTVRDRSIPIQMKRRAPDESVARFHWRKVQGEAAVLRSRVEGWAERNLEAISELEPELPLGITDRAADCVEPLLAIAEQAGGHWPESGRAAAVALLSPVDVENDSVGVQLLADTRRVFAGVAADRLATADLLTKLTALEESPWADLGGKPITSRKLAELLRPFGIRSGGLRFGLTTARGYELSDFADVWARYLPAPRAEAEAVPSASVSPVAEGDVTEGIAPLTSEVTDVAFVSPPFITSEELDRLLG